MFPLRIIAFSLPLLFASPNADLGRSLADWHAKRITQLKAEDGWLTLIAMHWLEEGEATVGSAGAMALRLPARAPPRLGVFRRAGREVTFVADPSVTVTLQGNPFRQGRLRADEGGNPEVLRAGDFQLLVIARGER